MILMGDILEVIYEESWARGAQCASARPFESPRGDSLWLAVRVAKDPEHAAAVLPWQAPVQPTHAWNLNKVS